MANNVHDSISSRLDEASLAFPNPLEPGQKSTPIKPSGIARIRKMLTAVFVVSEILVSGAAIRGDSRNTDDLPHAGYSSPETFARNSDETSIRKTISQRHPDWKIDNLLRIAKTEEGKTFYTADITEKTNGKDDPVEENLVFDENGKETSFGIVTHEKFENIDDLIAATKAKGRPGLQKNAIISLRYFKQHPEAMVALREALHSPDEDVKKAAIETIGYLKDRESVPLLLKMLEAEDQFYSVCNALIRIGDPSTITTLRKKLKTAFGQQKAAIINALVTAETATNGQDVKEYKESSKPDYKDSLAVLATSEVFVKDIDRDTIRAIAAQKSVEERVSENILPILAFDNFFEKIEKIPDLSIANVFSIAIATKRFLDAHELELDEKNLNTALKKILPLRSRLSQQEIFSSNRNVIIFTAEEDEASPFDNNIWINIATHSGVPMKNIQSIKDPTAQKTILDAIAAAQPNTTIVYSGHGEKEKLDLSQFKGEEVTRDEFVEALKTNKNTQTMTVLLDSCYSYDFIQKVIDGLKKAKIPVPTFISFASKEQASLVIASDVLQKISGAKKPGEPFTGKDFFSAESRLFPVQDKVIGIQAGMDMGFFVPEGPEAGKNSNAVEVSSRELHRISEAT